MIDRHTEGDEIIYSLEYGGNSSMAIITLGQVIGLDGFLSKCWNGMVGVNLSLLAFCGLQRETQAIKLLEVDKISKKVKWTKHALDLLADWFL